MSHSTLEPAPETGATRRDSQGYGSVVATIVLPQDQPWQQACSQEDVELREQRMSAMDTPGRTTSTSQLATAQEAADACDLLRRLLVRFPIDLSEEATQQYCGRVPSSHASTAAVTAPGRDKAAKRVGETAASDAVFPGPGFLFAGRAQLTSSCDRCTSTSFPKEET